ncbi:MAG: DUF4391 domain-containing protein [Deltaproteobacteria bacterium]|nr:DUF4391 domain-containing protein [Deltaproteobacteria bacterium]
MKTFDPVAALALPPDAFVDRRVPKALLLDNGAPTAPDKHWIREHIKQLHWLAALKPNTIGVAKYRDEEREYLEIAVLKLVLRAAPGAARPVELLQLPNGRVDRLVEIVHRAVPYPVLLVTWRGKEPEISMAHKRRSRADAAETVLDGEVIVVRLRGDCADQPVAAFREALALVRQPQTTLYALYQGWLDTLHALRAANVTGEFSLPTSGATATTRRNALEEYQRLNERIAEVHLAANKELQLSRRVELNLELARLRNDRDVVRSRL